MPQIYISDSAYEAIMSLKGDMTADEYVSRLMENLSQLSIKYELLEEDTKKLQSALRDFNRRISLMAMDTTAAGSCRERENINSPSGSVKPSGKKSKIMA